MDSLSLAILGVCLGHPAITSYEKMTRAFSSELEELDNAFDDSAYMRGWRPWGWKPGQCINCCETDNLLRFTDYTECQSCGWLQDAA